MMLQNILEILDIWIAIVEHLLKIENKLNLGVFAHVADCGLPFFSLSLGVAHKIELEKLVGFILEWQQRTYCVVDLALHFECRHEVGFSDDLPSSKGCHLECRIVGSCKFSEIFGFFTLTLEESLEGFWRWLWGKVWHFSALAAHALRFPFFGVFVVKELCLAMFAYLGHGAN